MTIAVVDMSQRKAARIAGALYLLLMACGVFAEFPARASLIADNDPARTASNILGSLPLFRLGIVSNLAAFAGDIAIAVALYVLLRPVGRYLALLAVLWRVAEAAVLGVMMLNSFTVLLLLTDPRYTKVFSVAQLQNLAWLFNDMHDAGYNVGMIFLALGCLVFSWLFFKSHYIPRLLAGFGLLAYAVMLIGNIVSIVYPDYPLGTNFYLPAGIYEIVIGVWLLIRGVRTPTRV